MSYARLRNRTAALTVIVFLLAACSTDHVEDLRQYVAQVKAKHKGPIEALPKIEPFVPYAYQANDRRDPFGPASAKIIQGASSAPVIQLDSARRKEPLEGFPLDALKMTGTLERGGERWAIIKASDGNVYWAKRGNYIGQSNGKITQITDTKTELIEVVPDGMGGWQENPTSLVMAE